MLLCFAVEARHIPGKQQETKTMALSESDQERVNASVEHGAKSFTEEDLKKVMADSATAEKKSLSLGDQLETFKVMWALIQDYWNGDYKNVPWKLIAAIGFAVAYLISPIDVIPDFIPILGFVDDAAVFALTLAAFQSEIDTYKEWKAQQKKKED